MTPEIEHELDLFEQFSSPKLLKIHLMVIAMIIPLMFFSHPTTRWLNNRQLTLQKWCTAKLAKQLFVSLNPKFYKWVVLLVSLFLYLISLNLLGLMPYTFTPTTQLSMNLALALPLWLTTVLIGLRHDLTATLAHLLPTGTPILLIPALIIIETISLLIRPLTLAFRMAANLTSGHLLIQLTSTATLFLTSQSMSLTAIIFSLMIMLNILELAVAMIQAYVFILLLSLYFQENIHE